MTKLCCLENFIKIFAKEEFELVELEIKKEREE